MKYHSGMAIGRPFANTPMLSERQRLSPLHLPFGLGLIMLVSAGAWVLDRLLG